MYFIVNSKLNFNTWGGGRGDQMCNKHSIIASTLTIFNVFEFQCEQLSSLISNIFINVIYNLLYIIYIFCVLYFLRRNFSTHCDRDREMERKRKKKGKERTREREREKIFIRP